MNELLTNAEIQQRHSDEWVLIDNPVTNDVSEVESGRVVFHSPDRDLVYRKAIELKLPKFALLYTGQQSNDVAVIL